jgi:ABC-type transport system substrate-binding protein
MQERAGRRARSARVAVGVLVAVLATVGATLPGSARTGAARDPSGTLRYGVGFSAFSGSLDPAASTSVCDSIALQFIYDGLIRNVDGAPAPGLAESWKLDGRTFTLDLRKGVKFQDGGPFDAAAVKQGLEHNMQGVQTHDGLAIITSIDVVDDHTVRLNLNTDTGATLPYVLSGREGMIVSPKTLDKGDAGTAGVGAGPYALVEYTVGGHLLVKKAKGYFDKKGQPFGQIDFVQADSGGPGVTALLAGDIDVFRPDAQQYDALNGKPDVGIGLVPSLSYLQLQLNASRPPFDKLKVRQAVNYAIDRDELNRLVLAGQGVIAWMPWPKGTTYHNAAVAERYPHNVKKAKQLLKEAGYPNGFDIEIVVPNGADFIDRQGQVLQQQLEKVGIHAKITKRDSNDVVPTFYEAHQGDAFAALRVGDPSPTGDIYEQWGKDQQVARWLDAARDDITQLMLDAQKSVDPNQIVKDVRAAEKIIVDNALDVEVAFLPQLVAWSKSRLAGTPKAPTQPCLPIDLSRTFLKK